MTGGFFSPALRPGPALGWTVAPFFSWSTCLGRDFGSSFVFVPGFFAFAVSNAIELPLNSIYIDQCSQPHEGTLKFDTRVSSQNLKG